jgi:excisionase family DNA binding protein
VETRDVLTTEEAAEFLRVSTKTVLTLARAGTLPGEKVGGAWRFPGSASAAGRHGWFSYQPTQIETPEGIQPGRSPSRARPWNGRPYPSADTGESLRPGELERAGYP